MSTSGTDTRVWRGTGVAAVVGGVAWVAYDIIDRLSSEDRMGCSSAYGYLQAGVDTVAFAAMVPILLGLFVVYRRSGKGWFGVTAILAAGGYATAGITNLLEHCFTGPISLPFPLLTGFTEPSPWVLGILLALAVIPFTLALTRVSFLPLWLAWILVVGSILSVARANQGGLVVFGVSLSVLGVYLLTHQATPPAKADASQNPPTVGGSSLPPRLTLLTLLIVVGLTLPGACASTTNLTPTIADARAELLGYVGDVTKADGYRYDAIDDRGHGMAGAKIIQIDETGEFAVVYFWPLDEAKGFTTSLATSSNLLDWTWRVDLSHDASQPTIKAASDGGYVVAWEVGVTDDIHVMLSYYRSWDALLKGQPSKEFNAERQLPGCGEGTPNLYSASSTKVDFGLHFYANCESDRQARGTTDWVTWEAVEQPLLDRAVLLQGYRGSVGDRDVIEFKGHEFTFLEGQFVQGDWGTFRVLVYDEEIGAADRVAFPDVSPEPQSVHLLIRTHGGSYSFSNMTVTQVEFEGRQALVVGVYIQRGAVGEEGPLIYYRIIDGPDG